VRLKERWRKEYETWRRRPLWEYRYAYIWADGIYMGAGLEKEKMALLCVLGARENGEKELLAMEPSYRESRESWKGVLRDLRDRGLEAPLLAVGDGALGLWAETRRRLREITEAETQEACEELRDRYVADLVAADQRAAAETVLRDWEDFVTFYHYPREHWIHLRTTNPLESIFSGVRLRTNAAKRLRRQDNALYLVFKIAQRLSQHWRPLNGGVNLLALVLEGAFFKDGIRQRRETRELVGTVA